MARKSTILLLRTTRANLNAQGVALNLKVGEPYFISGENRLAVGTSTSAYADFAKVSEVDGLVSGSSTHIQFNSAGVFSSSPNFSYSSVNNTLTLLGTNPRIILGSVATEPPVPAANTLGFYAKDIAGRLLPTWKEPSGLDKPIQQSLSFNSLVTVRPASAASQTVFGCAVSNVGLVSTPALTALNIVTSTRRSLFTGTNVAGALISQRSNTTLMWRGNAPNLGGFCYTTRFSLSTIVASQRAFVGISDVITAPTNVDPLTQSTMGRVGLAINSNTGNWNLINNILGTMPTVLALGPNFPVNTNDLLELVLFSPPNGSYIGYRVNNITTNIQTSGTLTTNIPSATTFLGTQFFMTNNTSAALFSLASLGWTVETNT